MYPYILIVLFSTAFGILSRLCGMKNGRISKVIYGLAYALPAIPLGILWAIPAAASGILFKVTGHGQYMDLGTYRKQSSRRQFLDFVVEELFGPDPNWDGSSVESGGNFWRDFFGLTITGIGVGIGLGAALSLNGRYLEACVIVLTAGLKGVAYLIGWTLVGFNPQGKFVGLAPTVIGEFLTGFFGGVGLTWTILRMNGVI